MDKFVLLFSSSIRVIRIHRCHSTFSKRNYFIFSRPRSIQSSFSIHPRCVATRQHKPPTGKIIPILNCLANNSPCDDVHRLKRLPYLCSVSGLGKRFISVLDRWWLTTWPMLQNDSDDLSADDNKPTSIVFHLGLLNQQHNGAVVRILGVESVGKLLALSSRVDFRSLPDRMDVLSYLAGVRDLIREPNSSRIMYPSLKPRSDEFFQNLERYLRLKAEVRKRAHEKNQSIGSVKPDEWIFMTTAESVCIFSELRELQFDLGALRRHGDRMLTLLNNLAKIGFDYYQRQQALPEHEKDEIRYRVSGYAGSCLHWSYDPDKLVPGSWQSWYGLFPLLRNGNGPISSIPAPEVLHYLNYLNYLPQVAERFHREKFFLPLFNEWLTDITDCSRFLSSTKIDGTGVTEVERIRCLTDLIYSCGKFAKYASSAKVIRKLEPIFSLLAEGITDLEDQSGLFDEALSRYLTGVRDFQSACSSVVYSAEFKEKLQSMVTGYFDRKRKEFQRNQRDDDSLTYYITGFMIVLRQLQLLQNPRLWNSLLKLYEIGFLGNTWNLFRSDRLQFLLCIARFCEVSWQLPHSPEFRIPENTWLEIFSAAKLFLENVDPYEKSINRGDTNPRQGKGTKTTDDHHGRSTASIDPPRNSNGTLDETQSVNGTVPLSYYRYLIGVLLSATRRFGLADEFERLKPIWQRRAIQVLPCFDSRGAYLTARKMKSLYNTHSIVFDQQLIIDLRERGASFEQLQRRDAAAK